MSKAEVKPRFKCEVERLTFDVAFIMGTFGLRMTLSASPVSSDFPGAMLGDIMHFD